MFQEGAYEWQSDFAKRYVRQGREEGREEGRKEGREEGREEGRQEGLEFGRVQTLVQSILGALEARDLSVPNSVRDRILACKDVDQLNLWFKRSVIAESADDIF